MRKLAMAWVLSGLALCPASVGASGDGGCGAHWALDAGDYDCASRIVIGPGHDARVNLLLLLNDRAGLDGRGLAYPRGAEVEPYNGRTFFSWRQLEASFYPTERPAHYQEPAEFYGSRCQSVVSGGDAFLAAVRRNRRIGARDRAALGEGREQLFRYCEATTSGYVPYSKREAHADTVAATAASVARDLPHSFASAEGREFGRYLAGAAAFYRGDWRAARASFAALRTARDAWVRETALYMLARNELGAAAAAGVDEWGHFDSEAGNKALAERAERALASYVAAYPKGRYVASAAGLVRRARWLGGASERQERGYARLLAKVDPATPAAAELIEEIEDKFLAHDNTKQTPTEPLLLAVRDLMRMRRYSDERGYYPEYDPPPLTADELARQQAAFAGHPELYAYLRASFAFHVQRDYHAVLRLLPDDARNAAYTPLQFSRQVLRGMALAELADPNEVGFWQQLLEGSKGLYQRPTVELGLALAWERRGQVANAFASGSPVEDERIRSLLLAHASGPDVLRGVARARERPQRERDLAAFVLLYKQLSRASYAAAARDFALARADASVDGWFYWDVSELTEIPVGLFARGRFSDTYACPALRATVAALARDPRDVKGRLCLGEFYRLNGFDTLRIDDGQADGELGSFAAYPGKPIPRSRLYDEIIAERGARREDRAYALYRAIRCYAPGGNSSCGGKEVPQAQRRAWFRRLKSEFAGTRWSREAKYYW